MKRFKDLRENLIAEAGLVSPWGNGDSAQSLSTDKGVHQPYKENIAKINSFIENFLNVQTMNPKARLEQLKIRLNHVGLDFNCNEGVTDGDITSYEVKYYGEVYGYKLDDKFGPTGEIGETDLATEKFGSPLVLSVESSGEGNVSLRGKLHFVNEVSDDEEMVGETLELRLKIENDNEIFESKFVPVFEDIANKMMEDSYDPNKAISGLVYATKAANKKYEMNLDTSEITQVAESFLDDLLKEEVTEEE